MPRADYDLDVPDDAPLASARDIDAPRAPAVPVSEWEERDTPFDVTPETACGWCGEPAGREPMARAGGEWFHRAGCAAMARWSPQPTALEAPAA